MSNSVQLVPMTTFSDFKPLYNFTDNPDSTTVHKHMISFNICVWNCKVKKVYQYLGINLLH